MSKENEGKIKKAIADVKRKINKAVVAGAVGVVVGGGAGYVAGDSEQDKQEAPKELKAQLKADIMELIERDYDEDPALRDIIRKYYTDKIRNVNLVIRPIADRENHENETKTDDVIKTDNSSNNFPEDVKTDTIKTADGLVAGVYVVKKNYNIEDKDLKAETNKGKKNESVKGSTLTFGKGALRNLHVSRGD